MQRGFAIPAIHPFAGFGDIFRSRTIFGRAFSFRAKALRISPHITEL
jgi:hypothetical protein